MPIPPILSTAPIVDPKTGNPSYMFLRTWQDLQDQSGSVPVKGSVGLAGQSASIAATRLFTVRVTGFYRVNTYLRRTGIDGTSSSLQATINWIEGAQPLSKALATMSADSLTEVQGESSTIYADAESDITLDVNYASNTPHAMIYELFTSVEQIQVAGQ
jgi:hypothetical protein